MKKIMKISCLVLSFCIMAAVLCGCGGEDVEIAIEDVLNANSTKSLLENYNSISVTYEYEDGTEYGYYADSELGYCWDEEFSEVTSGDIQYVLSEGVYYRCFYAGMKTDVSSFEYLAVDPELFLVEDVVKCKQKGDVITLTTKIFVEEMEELGYEFSEDEAGGYFLTEYYLDANSLDIRKIKERFVYEDGVKALPNTMVVEYNAARPEQADTLLARAKQNSDVRTLTVVLDPNTTEEKSFTATTPKGDAALFYVPEEYIYVYTDRECTVEYDGTDDWNEDLTLYVTK